MHDPNYYEVLDVTPLTADEIARKWWDSRDPAPSMTYEELMESITRLYDEAARTGNPPNWLNEDQQEEK